ncbi:MAG: hypothetical protein U1D55_12400 [Phycisphaerae bacterium]
MATTPTRKAGIRIRGDAWTWLITAAILAVQHSAAQSLLTKVSDARLERDGTRLVVLSPREAAARCPHVVLFSPDGPVGRYDHIGDDGAAPVFARAEPPPLPSSREEAVERGEWRTASDRESPPLRAWLVPGEYSSGWAGVWPASVGAFATVDAIGLGQRSVWLGIGSDAGVALGDVWLMRLAGQPVARAEARFVDREMTNCRITPLAAKVQFTPGQRFQQWSPRGGRKDGPITSAVAFVTRRAGDPEAWIAAPPLTPQEGETPVEFRRRGAYVGQGVVERREERFWHVRLLAGACIGEVRVGDNAVVRAAGDLLAGRAAARVFEISEGGALINCGEFDGVTFGQPGVAWRDGERLTEVLVGRVQRGFCVVRPRDPESGVALRALDEVLFAPRPPPPRVVGMIEQVTDDICLAVSLPRGGETDRDRLYAVVDGTRTIGAAALVYIDGTRGLGVLLPASTDERATAGMMLVEDSRSTGVAPAPAP